MYLVCSVARSRGSSSDRFNIFLISQTSREVLGPTESPIQWISQVHCQGTKRPGSEADCSHPTSAKVKKQADLYEGVFIMSGFDAAICTAVVVARCNGR
jgi:hypothetical protein